MRSRGGRHRRRPALSTSDDRRRRRAPCLVRRRTRQPISSRPTRPGHRVLLETLGGALIGAGIGVLIGVERWERLALPAVPAGVDVVPRGRGVAVRLTLRR